MRRKLVSIAGSSLLSGVNYLARKGHPSKPADLTGHECLHYCYPSTGKLEPWPLKKSGCGANALVLPMTLVSSSLDALLYLAEDGRGITCVPDFAVKVAIAEGSLESVLVTYMKRSATFHVFWPNSKQMSPKVRVFVDHVASDFAMGLVSK